MEKYEAKKSFSDEDSEVHEYSEKEIQETKQQLKKLSFGEKVVLHNLDTTDPQPDGPFTDIYRFGDKKAPQ